MPDDAGQEQSWLHPSSSETLQDVAGTANRCETPTQMKVT